MFISLLALAAAPSVAVGQSRAVQSAVGSLGGLISSDDYPPQALDRNEQGTVGILLRVSPQGGVAECIIERSSGSAVLDAQTCRLMSLRARFLPALDAQGRPTSGEYHSKVAWRIGEDWVLSDPWSTRIVLDFGSDSKLLNCRVEADGAMTPMPGEKPLTCPSDLSGLALPDSSELPTNMASLVIEQRLTLGPSAPPALGSLDKLIERQVASLDIDATGKVTSCRAVEERHMSSARNPCPGLQQLVFHPRPDGQGHAAPFTAVMAFNIIVHVQKLALAD